MYLVTSISAALICYAITVSAAPPPAPTPYLVPSQSISQTSNYTIGLPKVLASPTFPQPCRVTSRAEKYRMTVRGTRTILDIVLCLDVTIDLDNLQDTLIAAINIFQARLELHGDGIIDPDPWYAPVVEGRDCGLAVKSGAHDNNNTLTYQVGLDALIGMFKFYKEMKMYSSSLTVVIDKNLAEPDWGVGEIVIGPFDI